MTRAYHEDRTHGTSIFLCRYILTMTKTDSILSHSTGMMSWNGSTWNMAF